MQALAYPGQTRSNDLNRKTGNSKGGLARDITIFDVADEAGVSYSTVSRVVNNKSNVHPETRERVLRTMAQLGYVGNVPARSLAGGSSHVVGLLVDHLNTSYMGEIIRGIDEVLDANNYNLMLYTTHRRKTKESAYVTKLTRNFADGLLLILPRNEKAYLETLHQRRFPHVLVDYQGYNQQVPSVITTNRKGAYDATTFLSKSGIAGSASSPAQWNLGARKSVWPATRTRSKITACHLIQSWCAKVISYNRRGTTARSNS